jgi:hypothetical protein
VPGRDGLQAGLADLLDDPAELSRRPRRRPGIPLINSIGNLGGFVAPFAFGINEDTTGSSR